MCGIAGLWHLTGDRRVDEGALARATDALAHRGPDGRGLFTSGGLGLGHRRLSIIDLEGGAQPMSDGHGHTVVFNGEIYNYVELTEQLVALGHRFETTSDTEVILAAYRQWGVDCLDHFNGMWAFALYDATAQRLFLARDRLGEKPLYWAHRDGTFYFGSEPKALFEAGHPREADLRWLEAYLCLSYVPAPYSFYRGVSALPPAHRILVEAGRVDVRRWWRLPEIDEGAMRRDAEAVQEEFAALLGDSVKLRMRSDVPFGAFLSGGLDSASVVALMSDVSPHPVQTFTIGFDDPAFDERHLARAVADRFGTHHRESTVEPDSFDDALRRVVHHHDEPFGDSSSIPTGHVCAVARRHVKMVLTGDGGDEVLSGYTQYQGEKFAAGYGRLPRVAQRALEVSSRKAAAPFTGAVRHRLNRAANVLHASSLPFETRLVEKLSRGQSALIRRLLGASGGERVAIEELVEELMATCGHRDPMYRLMHFHLTVSLPSDMLVKVDRMAMAHALEARVPFLDHRLVELMVGVHRDVKMRGLERKSVLRRSVGTRLPAPLLSARKKGFGLPLREWFRDTAFESRLRGLVDIEGGLDRGTLDRVVDDTVHARQDHGNLLWSLFVVQHWLRGM